MISGQKSESDRRVFPTVLSRFALLKLLQREARAPQFTLFRREAQNSRRTIRVIQRRAALNKRIVEHFNRAGKHPEGIGG